MLLGASGIPPAPLLAPPQLCALLLTAMPPPEGGHGGGHLALCAVPKASLAFCGCPWEVSWLRAPTGLSGFPRDTGWLCAADPSRLGTG